MGTSASFAHSMRGLAVAVVLSAAGCATVERVAYTQQEQSVAVVPGFPDARVWADDPDIARKTAALAPALCGNRPFSPCRAAAPTVHSARACSTAGARAAPGRNSPSSPERAPAR
jgi:hypothetical protein